MDHRVTRPCGRGPVMTAEYVDAPCVTAGSARPFVRFTCQTAKRNPPQPWFGAAVAVVSPPWHSGLVPSKPRGRSAEWRLLEFISRLAACASLGEGTLRPSALRAAAYGIGVALPSDGAFPAFALGVAVNPVANGSRGSRSAPGASPVPPGGHACEARHAGAAPRSAFERLRRRPR